MAIRSTQTNFQPPIAVSGEGGGGLGRGHPPNHREFPVAPQSTQFVLCASAPLHLMPYLYLIAASVSVAFHSIHILLPLFARDSSPTQSSFRAANLQIQLKIQTQAQIQIQIDGGWHNLLLFCQFLRHFGLPITHCRWLCPTFVSWTRLFPKGYSATTDDSRPCLIAQWSLSAFDQLLGE